MIGKLKLLCLCVLLLQICLFGQDARQVDLKPVPTDRYWLFLSPETRSLAELSQAIHQVESGLTKRSLIRRSKVIKANPPIRKCDLLPSSERLEAIEASGCKIVRVLRYLNAVTVTGNPNAVSEARNLSFVAASRPVMALPRQINPEIAPEETEPSPYRISDAAAYGQSYRQLALVNIPAVHERGYRGSDVIIGVQDTGFDNLGHVCFSHLEILAAYDFVNNDLDIADQQDMGSGSHGLRVLSVIAGLDSGNYIGAAPFAQYILTKTENTQWEMRLEEDDWVAGLWFHDSLGTDVLSSSLSYRAWYGYEELDGETAITTIAADSAVGAGMVIVNSAGNTGRDGYPFSKIGAPSDGNYVICVGGVLQDSSHWGGSSQGPSYDGRIKPDVSSMSIGVYTANNYSQVGYMPRNGTSYSCPLTSGIVALILEANPELTPAQVMQILHETSSYADNPDTLYGYGIPDALAAVIMAESMSVRTTPILPVEQYMTAFPNPFNSMLNVSFKRGFAPEFIELRDLQGRIVSKYYLSSSNIQTESVRLIFDGFAAGCYLISASGKRTDLVQKVVLIK